MEQAKVLINLVAPQNLNIFYEGRISYGKKVLCYLSLQHNDVSENNTDDPKSSDDDATKTKKMNSARYNLFRYKSKDITDMTYNCKYPCINCIPTIVCRCGPMSVPMSVPMNLTV